MYSSFSSNDIKVKSNLADLEIHLTIETLKCQIIFFLNIFLNFNSQQISLQLIRAAACWDERNETVSIIIPFKDNKTLNEDIFQKCIQQIKIQNGYGDFVHFPEKNRTENYMAFEEIRMRIYYRDPYRKDEDAVKSSVITLNNSQVRKCYFNPFTMNVIIIFVAVGVVLLLSFTFIIICCRSLVRKKKNENRENVDANPDYNDPYYAPAELKDTNSYYYSSQDRNYSQEKV